MKKSILIISIMIISVVSANAQRGPLRGSGKLVFQSFEYTGFDKIDLSDLNGVIEIEVGQPYSIKVTIDDNLQNLFEVTNNSGKLKVGLRNNKNNSLYIEDTHIKIKISLPEISVLEHRGNSTVKLSGIIGRYLRILNDGNGTITANGSIDSFDLKNEGNGDILADNLLTKEAMVSKAGNGDITVNVSSKLQVKAAGNGDIINKGNADFQVTSKSGNGDLIKKN
ncbi:MAG: GIN domain-containing protein [Chitinophagaceae bacterium]